MWRSDRQQHAVQVIQLRSVPFLLSALPFFFIFFLLFLLPSDGTPDRRTRGWDHGSQRIIVSLCSARPSTTVVHHHWASILINDSKNFSSSPPDHNDGERRLKIQLGVLVGLCVELDIVDTEWETPRVEKNLKAISVYLTTVCLSKLVQ